MDPITQQTALASAGGKKDPVYVDDIFSTYLYDGSGNGKTITNGIDLAGEGGLVWIKNRTGTQSHLLFDTERGALNGLLANANTASASYADTLTAFNSTGFTVDNSYANVSGGNYVSWSFRKAPGFLDVVTYTGTGSARTVAHSLGSVPGMILIKCTTHTSDWSVYHRSMGATKNMHLNTTSAADTQTGVFNDTEPTSTHFTVNYDGDVNGSGKTYVAYIFAHDDASFGTDEDESIIKCGSYTTAAGTGFATVDLGWEPQFVLWKGTDVADEWHILDTARGWTVDGQVEQYLNANTSDAEGVTNLGAPLATGFFASRSANSTYIYMAIRRPNKPPEAATEVFAIDTYGGTSPTPPTYISGFPVDAAIRVDTTGGNKPWANRLMGIKFQYANLTNAEDSASSFKWDYMNGWASSTDTNSGIYSYMFKRAPGFMDVVAYTGTGSATTINHNLGAVPSVVLIKGRNTTYSWYWQHYALGANTFLQLNNTDAGAGNGNIFNNTLPTSSVFSLGSLAGTNGSGNTYIAYLFGDLPGISKAGTYTGTGNDINVDCGFTNGARFVLIKRSDVGGDWDLMDSVRGFAIGNDNFLALNTTAAQASTHDFIDPLNTGFTVSAAAPNDINQSGGTYIFLAIA